MRNEADKAYEGDGQAVLFHFWFLSLGQVHGGRGIRVMTLVGSIELAYLPS